MKTIRLVRAFALLSASAFFLASSALSAPLETVHCGEITSDQSWTSTGNDHRVCSSGVRVTNATLTLSPGVLVKMDQGASIVIGDGASLQAPGDPGAGTIRIQGSHGGNPQPGFWGQIKLTKKALPSTLTYVTIMGGGRDGVPMVESHVPISINGFLASNAAYPTVFGFSGGLPLALAANVVGPSLETAGSWTVGRQCFVVTFDQNAVEAIGVLAADPIDVTISQTWYNFCVPYRVTEAVTIGGPETPYLAIDYGATVEFDGDAGIVAGYDAQNTGQLAVRGTRDKPVLLTGVTKTPGSWNGIDFTPYSEGGEDSEGNSFSSCTVEYGGRGGRPMVSVRSADILAVDSQFNHAAANPIALLPSAVGGFVTGLTKNVDPAFNDNAVNRLLVLAAETPVDIPFNTTWGNPGAAFEIDGPMLVAGGSKAASLTLAGNPTLSFDLDGELIVGDPVHGRGILRATGYVTEPVTLTGAAGTPGSWIGVTITEQADQANLEHIAIQYGGAGGRPMVLWGKVPGTLVKSTLRGAAAYPIQVPLSRVEVVMGDVRQGERRNTVGENGTDRILVNCDAQRTSSLVNWTDPGAPLEFDGDVVIGAVGVPSVDLGDGLVLQFREGHRFQLGADERQRAVLRVVDEMPQVPVVIGPVDEGAGWDGMHVLAGSSMNGGGLSVRGAAADEANLAIDGGAAVLDGLELKGAKRGIGLNVVGASSRASILHGRFVDNRIGVHSADGGLVDITYSIVQGNTEYGVQNEDRGMCQTVEYVYWGAATGPNDASGGRDGCMNAKNSSAGADNVSDYVDWWPYAVDTSYRPSQGIGPNPHRAFLPALKRFN